MTQQIEFKLKKGVGVPLYIQLENQIIGAIKTGYLKANARIPTEREMAQRLSVSRKTVSRAYRSLEKRGILSSEQGRGTFVQSGVEAKYYGSQDQLIDDYINKVIDTAIREGIDEKNLIHLFTRIAKNKYQNIERLDAVFIECNIEQAQSFSKALAEVSQKQIKPYTLADIKNMTPAFMNQLAQTRVIITTFNHVGEIKEHLRSKGIEKRVMGVAITPNLESMIKISKYATQSKIGLISLSEEFFFSVKSALKLAGLEQVDLVNTTTLNPDMLKAFMQDLDVIVVSPGRMESIKKIQADDLELIAFEYVLDKGSVEVVLSKLAESEGV
jgi:DNA-binding transcriptional regulator YhcF (GntR family)